ncbi:telomere-protecting terminal protein Tpg [[Kitasatospora] papulosa]|uniref:telomere-protecting terminal protein Tpg n=1 Tax=[Kitasatospora] papulosa TaxID=1464011 RepID=UPI0037F19964
MEEISQGLERLLHTQPLPSTTMSRLRALLRWEDGSTRQVAALLGVSQRTVQRWVTRDPARRTQPGIRHQETIAGLVRARWQPRIRARRRAKAEEHGGIVHTRARFGSRAGAGSRTPPAADPGRAPGRCGDTEMFAALDAGEERHRPALSRALSHACFRDSGRRTHHLYVVLSGIAFTDLDHCPDTCLLWSGSGITLLSRSTTAVTSEGGVGTLLSASGAFRVAPLQDEMALSFLGRIADRYGLTVRSLLSSVTEVAGSQGVAGALHGDSEVFLNAAARDRAATLCRVPRARLRRALPAWMREEPLGPSKERPAARLHNGVETVAPWARRARAVRLRGPVALHQPGCTWRRTSGSAHATATG